MKKSIAILLCSFVAIYTINFFIPRLMPGDPFNYSSSVSGEDLDSGYTEEQLKELRAYYGLDQPIGAQFVQSVKRLLHGDLGQSIYYKRPVIDVLAVRLPWSLYIMLSSLIVSLFLGVAMALICRSHKKMDKVFYSIFSAQAEIPSFLIAILLLFLIAARYRAIPLSGNLTPFATYASLGDKIYDIFIHSLLPILSMVLVTLPQFYFTARASFLSVEEKLYVTYAHAKGLRPAHINTHYILRNSISPLVMRFFLSIGTAVSGTILIENVFSYPGLGRVLREAVMYRDYPMIQGVFLLSTCMVLVSVFIADAINYIHGRRCASK